MCMKNVNVTSIFCENDPSLENGSIQLGSILHEIEAKPTSKESSVIVDELTVITFANAFAETEAGDLDKKYDILWILESSDSENTEKIQLVQTVYDTARSKRDREANQTCRSFSNQIFKFTIKNLELKGIGRYFLKIYLKDNEESTWQIQSINTIYIKSEVQSN